jgi:hypothetical protein
MKAYISPELKKFSFETEEVLGPSQVVVVPPSQGFDGEDETDVRPIIFN